MQKQSKKAAKASSEPRLRAIFASVEPLTAAPSPEKQIMRAHTCANCSSTFALNQLVVAGAAEGNDAIQPFCPDCGSAEVQASEGAVEVASITDDEAVAVACYQCNTQHIFSAETQAGFHSAMNCTVCGVTVAFDESADEEEETELNLDDDLDEDLDIDDLDEGDDAFATTAEEQEDETGDSLTNAPADTVEATDTGDASQAEEETDNQELNNAPSDTVEASDEDLEELELVDALESIGDEEATASFVRIGDRVVAFLNDVSVGSLHKQDVLASKQEAFQSPNYLKALSNSFTVAGMSTTLNDFGFQKHSIQVSAKRVTALSDAKVEARAEALAGAHEERFARDYGSAMGLAHAGINKGFWKDGQANPLKVAFASELRQAGLKNPDRLIDRVFASAGDAYFKLLQTRAAELLNMDPTVTNHLSTAIASMRYDSGYIATASDEDESEEEDTEESSTVAHAVRPGVRRALSAEATASFGDVHPQADGSAGGIHELAVELRQKHGRLF